LTEDLSVHSLISRFHYSYSFNISLLKRQCQFNMTNVYLFFVRSSLA
jgi:non-ribosomal peptide synthetase component E (peptide arylation enzyme)